MALVEQFRDSLAFYSEITYQDSKKTLSGPTMDAEASVGGSLSRYSGTVYLKIDAENRIFCLSAVLYLSLALALLERTVIGASMDCLHVVLARFFLTQCLFVFCE